MGKQWRFEYDNDTGPSDEGFSEFYNLINGDGETVGKISEKEDAATIVNCVNCHADLLEACTAAEEMIRRLIPDKGVHIGRIHDKLKTAIQKATGVSHE